jgi:hypothetical protein
MIRTILVWQAIWIVFALLSADSMADAAEKVVAPTETD